MNDNLPVAGVQCLQSDCVILFLCVNEGYVWVLGQREDSLDDGSSIVWRGEESIS